MGGSRDLGFLELLVVGFRVSSVGFRLEEGFRVHASGLMGLG